MATRVVEWKKPYTWWKAIDIDENKVISLRLRDENNLIIRDEWDNEIYVDLQLPDWIRPTDAFPVWVTTGRVLVADDWDVTGTLVCFKTTSWDNIKLLYWDNWKLWIDNWTWTFKQIYLKWEVDALLTSLRNYVDWQLLLKQDVLTAWENITIHNNVISAIGSSANGRFLSQWSCITWEPISFPASTPFEYLAWDYYLVSAIDTWTNPTNYKPNGASYTWAASSTTESWDVGVWDIYVYDGTAWLLQINHNATVSFANIAWQPSDNTNLANALNAKQDELVSGTNIKTINNSSILGSWNLTIDAGNTKTFYLSWTWSSATVLAEAQAAYDWYDAGKNPIVMYDNVAYILSSVSSSVVYFKSLNNTTTTSGSQVSSVNQFVVAFSMNSWNVTEVSYTSMGVVTNILKTNVNYWTPYTPTYDWSPATKKYVDDRDTYIGSSAPTSNLVEWRLWYDTTNDQLKVYDWTNWNVTGAESNTKTFTITWTTGTANIAAMQEAIDWLNADKCPIIYYNTPGYETYWFYTAQYKSSSSVKFQRNRWLQDASAVQLAPLNRAVLSVSLTNGNVTSMSYASKIQSVLTTDNTTSYTPSWNYNPATKKYVDDTVDNTWVKKIDVWAVSDWAVWDDWTDVMSILDWWSAAILYDSSDLETYYLATQINYSGNTAVITVVTWENTYKVTLDSNNEISAIETYYMSPNPIQVVASLPANPDANTIYIVQ